MTSPCAALGLSTHLQNFAQRSSELSLDKPRVGRFMIFTIGFLAGPAKVH